jgi:N-acetylneuraminate synthase
LNRSTSSRIELGNRHVGGDAACFVIAEAGVNHDGRLDQAHRLIDAAARAGADAIKFQTFAADKLASRTAPKANYQLRQTDAEESQHAMLHRLELPLDGYAELASHAGAAGVVFLSSPFDTSAADLLDDIGVCAFKIPSGEVTNLPFLRHVARKRKPMLMSTGMASLAEVAIAVDAIHAEGLRDLVLLHCVSNYPADAADVNLRAMATVRDAFDVPVGYSDHTLGLEIAWAAVARGACVLEKHLTLDRHLPGPDHAASIEPDEFERLVTGVRRIETALGSGRKVPAASEAATAAAARKSLAAACVIPSGVRIDESMVTALRPGTGLSPADPRLVIGRTARVTIADGELFSWENLE